MKRAILELLAILALAGAGGTIYSLAMASNPEKHLAWVDKRYEGFDRLAPGSSRGHTAPGGRKEIATQPKEAVPPVASDPAPGTKTAPPAEAKGIPVPADPVPADPAPKPAAPADPPPATAADGEFPMIGFDEASEEYTQETTLFIDARRSRDYELGHIPGARSMSAHEAGLLEKIAQIQEVHPAEAPIVIYCTNSKDCEDSKIVGRQLKEAGFLNISIYSGGFPEWQKEKRPVATGKEPGKREDA